MRESALERQCVRAAQARGWLVRKLKWIGRDGAPDRVFFRGGKVMWLEFKAPGEEPKPIQLREHKRMRSHGASVHVVDSWKLFDRIISRYED